MKLVVNTPCVRCDGRKRAGASRYSLAVALVTEPAVFDTRTS